jgi:hypothetical protein
MTFRPCAAVLFTILSMIATAQGEDVQVSIVSLPDTSLENPRYSGNRPPLVPSPFIRLPTGTVKPKGWVKAQLELQADGYLGQIWEVSGFMNKCHNAWLNEDGRGEGFWEEVPYWLRGYVSLACLLDDPKLIAKAKAWLEPSIEGQRANGHFGTEALSGDGGRRPPDLMPHQNMLYAYRSSYDGTGEIIYG